MRILVVRLSSLGDVVHAIPVTATLRKSFPAARIDWVIDERYRDFVDLVSVVDHRISVPTGQRVLTRFPGLVRELRSVHYDVAIDLQGLWKSALIARVSGAKRVIGFEAAHLREPSSKCLYTEVLPVGSVTHIIEKNLALVAHLGACTDEWEFPINECPSEVVVCVRKLMDIKSDENFVLINPGAAWSSKRWQPEHFGLLAQQLSKLYQMKSAVLWGPGEETLAKMVVAASAGAAVITPPTNLIDLVALARAATVMVAGDTGPLHVAAAVHTPVVGVYGPSNPKRNGPWMSEDVAVSRFETCGCQKKRSRPSGVVVRRCVQRSSCLSGISVEDVTKAVEQRLKHVSV